MPPSRLDLYLAGAIARRAEQHDRLRAAGVDPAIARTARDSIDAGTLREANAGNGSLNLLIRAFGKPALRRVERVAWNLAVWPDHRYECQLREWGVAPGEFVRAAPDGAPVVDAVPASLDAAVSVFRPWMHTRRDLERALGDPLHDEGRYPDERCEWRLGDGTVASFEFTHGLLMAIVAAAPRAVAAAAARPWWKRWRR